MFPANQDGSYTMYNPHSCDFNDVQILPSREARTAALQAFYNEHVGKQIYVKHAKSGEVRLWEITPISAFTRAGWVWCEHILFGMWRLATPEDIAKFQAQLAAKTEQAATTEARRMAQASGLVLKDMAQTAATIAEFNKLQAPQPLPLEKGEPEGVAPEDALCEIAAEPSEPERQPEPVERPARRKRRRKA